MFWFCSEDADMSTSSETPQKPRTVPAPAPPGKVFKKCKSATFHIDGATYTIGKCFL